MGVDMGAASPIPTGASIDAESVALAAAALQRQGRHADALELYRRLLAVQPENPPLQALVGSLLARLGQPDQGIGHLLQADALAPGNPETLHNLAGALAACDRPAEAADVWNRLGSLFHQRGDVAAAETLFRRALDLRPGHFGAGSNLGAVLQATGRHAEALARTGDVLAAHPEEAEAHSNFGNALMGAGDPDGATAAYRCALALSPDYFEAHSNLGLALCQARGTNPLANPLAAARLCHGRALALRPDFAAARWNLALCLLLQGDFAEGWRAYEWRWRWPGFGEQPRPFPQPVWRGEPPEVLAGPLLVTAEQGYGDTLQFARYAVVLAALGHDVVLEVQCPLFTLLWTSLGRHGVRVVPRAESPAQVHDDLPFARHVPLMSLPERLDTRLDSVPQTCPYLFAEPSRAALWRNRLAAVAGPALRVGLVWKGRPDHGRDRDRSMALADLEPLLGVPDVHFFVLHKEGTVEPRPNLTPLAPLLHDFAETAAAVDALDLVIAVDTAVAHLAGGLGRPVWLLLPFVPDWRWLLGRDDSPWYPGLTLLRQEQPGGWRPVVDEAARRLRACAETGEPPR